ncbi:DsbA family protein [Nocardia sp. NPDC052566]|uniref:DsbA family protein n=1 Tax=Nocardia sp. NPDC052566 TaxID=3364330 RepID=UPI0037CAAD2A
MSRRVDSARRRLPSKKRRPRPNSRNRKLAGAAALLAAAVLLVFAIIQLNSRSDAKRAEDAKPAASAYDDQFRELAKLARRDGNDGLAIGPANAPVVMIEYSDFQCPYCGQFALKSEPELITQYVEQGALRIEWRNFPIFGKESEGAAQAAWAAGQQGRFWEFHKTLFENRPEKKNTGVLTPDRLAELAEQAGVPDIAKFRADAESDAAKAAVQRDMTEGYQLGVTSTPAFLINGRPLLGAQPIEQFRALIDAARKGGEAVGK